MAFAIANARSERNLGEKTWVKLLETLQKELAESCWAWVRTEWASSFTYLVRAIRTQIATRAYQVRRSEVCGAVLTHPTRPTPCTSKPRCQILGQRNRVCRGARKQRQAKAGR